MKLHTIALVLLAAFAPAAAQTVAGRIGGTVYDPVGAATPGARITLKNPETGIQWNAVSDARGSWVVTNLPPGPYEVAVEMSGFKRVARTGFDLKSDGRLTADFTLEVGEITASVEVRAVAGETVNVVSGEISRTVDQEQVQDLALNGRNYMQLVTLIPGAALLNDDQLSLTTSLSSAGQAINGNRPATNNLTVDGSYNLDAGSNTTQINNVGVDFIREVQVQTSNFSAEYGRQSGASINAVTRSGGNAFHGSAFEFIRNEKLDARNFFSPSKPALRFNDFGWSLGGPIRKNKLYFFAGQEWKPIRTATSPALRTLPTRAERRGDFSGRTGNLNLPGTSTPIPNRNVAPFLTADGKAIAAVYDKMESLAASYTDTPTGNNTIYQLNSPFDMRQDLLRIDYRINERHSAYVRYMHDNYTTNDPFGTYSPLISSLPTVPGRRERPSPAWQAAHTWLISPRIINEAKGAAAWHGQRVFLTGSNWEREQYGFQFKDLYPGGGRYPTGIPGISVVGFSGFLGPGFYSSTTADMSFSDTASFLLGAHTVRAGVLVTRNRKDANGRTILTGAADFNTAGNPRTSGNGWADALMGNFRTYTEGLYDPFGFFRFSQFDAFVTDQWKLTRRLSIEFGARFQTLWPVYTQANNVTNFVRSAYNPARAVTVTNAGVLVAGSGDYYNGLVRAGSGVPESEAGRVPDAKSERVLGVPAGAPRGLSNPKYPVAPRFSFAWAPFAQSRTAVRGGFGIFYDRVDQIAIVQALANPPFAESLQRENGSLADPSGGNVRARGVLATVRAIDPDMKAPYTMHYSLGIQREVGRGIFLDVAYVGNQSRHLMRGPDINAPSFATLSANSSLPAAQQASINALRTYKGYSSIFLRLAEANANYNGLQIHATKRKGWLTWTGSYTWSKALTDASSNTDTSDEPYNRRFNYGLATFDRRHVAVSTWNAKLPWLAKAKGVKGFVAGGWEVSGIARAQSGQHYNVVASTAIGSRRADYIGGPLEGDKTPQRWFNTAAFATPPATRYGTSGPAILPGPGMWNVDLSLRKQFRVTEQVRVRFQGDLFNAFNHTNLRGLNLNTTSRDFGAVTGASPARNIQGGLRLTF